MMLQGAIPPYAEDTFRLLTQDSDWIEEQDFTLIHKAVLGLSMTDTEDAILQCPIQLDDKDGGGRTPLAWAAARGDERLVALLLGHGANPNVMEAHGSTPLYNAAEKGSAKCCRLLLEAGARPDPERPPGTKAGTALMTACTDAVDPLVLQTLIDFGASLESCGADGKTSLIQVARTDNVEFAYLLLESGANVNASTVTGETPLTTAVTHNSHKVLKLLLDRWFEYSKCPRLTGPHLLYLVARYADCETISSLTDTDHLRLKYDKAYGSGDYTGQLLERFDADEKLQCAFKDLLSVINESVPARESSAGWLESGLQRKYGLPDKLAEISGIMPGTWAEETEGKQSESGDDAFEDALERLDLGSS